jgi:hypothetical protein
VNFIFLIFTLLFTKPLYAKKINDIAFCEINKSDFSLKFRVDKFGESYLQGSVDGEEVNCKLDLERIVDGRQTQSRELMRVQTHRTEKKCIPKLSAALSRGIEDHITFIFYRKTAKIYLFEEYTKLKCDTFSLKAKKLLELKKNRNIDSISKKRKGRRLKLNSIEKSKYKK